MLAVSDEHIEITAVSKPRPEERCWLCGERTGHAGVGDGSIYCECGDGPFCDDCWHDHFCEFIEAEAAGENTDA